MNRREHAKIFMAVAIILCMSLSMTPAAMADTSGDGYLANMSNLKESEIISANRAMKNEEDAIIAYNEVISSFSLIYFYFSIIFLLFISSIIFH